MAGYVDYKTASAVLATRPSPIIWADCPVIDFLRDPGKGFHFFDDFLTLSCQDATTEGGTLWYLFIASGGSVALDDGETGILNMDLGATDNEEVTIVTGDNTTGLIVPADGSTKKWWFEARFALGTITNANQACFLGLTEEGQAAATKPMEDDGTHAMNDIDHVGFHVDGADGDGLNFVWRLSGQTAQSTADVATISAVDTYYRVGMKYEPQDNKVHVFVNGVENTSAAFLMSHASAPADNLAVCIAVKADGGTPDNMAVDWVRVAAEY